MSKKTKKPLTKKKKVWILVAALSVFLAAAVTAGAFLLPMFMGSPADPKVSWYSEEQTEFTISTADQLYDLAYLSSKYNFEGQTIKLDADIVINDGDASTWGETPPSRLWYPIANFNGTFDGQGHTISGLYGVSFNEEMGLFSFTDKRAKIMNLRVVNSYLKSSGEHGTGFISANGGGTFENIYVDGIIHSDNWNNGGIIGCVDLSGDTAISNCWFAGKMILVSDQGRVAGGIVGDIMPENGVVSIAHCLNTGSYTAEAITHTGRGRLMDIGGIVGRASSGTTNLTDCFANTKIESGCMIGAGGLIGSAGKGKTNLSHCFYVKADDTNAVGYRYNQTVGDVYTYTPEYVTGFEAYSWTTLDFENFWAVDEDGTPILKTFADKVPDLKGVKRMIDTSWYTKRNTATISTIEQLRGLHVVTQWDSMAGKTIYLGADIVVQEGDASEWEENAPDVVWKGLSNANVMFQGTFDGMGHSISGMYQKAASNGLGLFVAVTDGATIRNLSVLNSYFETNNVAVNNQTYSYIGSVAAYARGATFDTVYSNAIMKSDGYFCGGIVGLMRNGNASTIMNSWYDGKIKLVGENTGMRGGGLIGCVWNTTLNMSHCLNTGEMSSESWAWGSNQGLMVGYPNATSNVNIEDSLCAATFYVLDGKKDGNGMIVGRIAGDSNVTFKNVYAIRTPNPPAVKDAEKQWLCDWGLTGHRDAPVTFQGPAMILDKKYLTGLDAYRYTDLDFKNYWAVDLNGHPRLQAFMGEDEEILDVSNYSKYVDYSWYGPKDTLYLSNAKQFKAFSLIASGDTFKDKTIILAADIKLNEGNAADWAEKAPANAWIPIGNADNMFGGTFDGRGHTISGVYCTGSGNGLGLFGMVRNATVKNFKLTNSFIRSNGVTATKDKESISSYNYIGGVAAYGANATFDSIYTDAIVWNDGEMCGGIVGLSNKVNEPITLNNCWFDGTLVQEDAGVRSKSGNIYHTFYGGLLGLLRNNSATISHCLVTGTFKGINIPDDTWGTVCGGMVGRADQTGENKASLTIIDSLSNIKTEGYPSSIAGNGTVISQCNPNVPMILDNVYAVNHSWKSVAAWRSPELGKGGVVTLSKENLTGASAFQHTTLDFEKYWTVEENNQPILKTFASKDAQYVDTSKLEKVADFSWYNADEDVYHISTAKQLAALSILAGGNTFSGKTIYLDADITLNEGNAADWATTAPANEWTPIGNSNTMFAGTFDGQGHTISGLYLSEPNNGLGLFGMVKDATIKNLKLTNSLIRSTMVDETNKAGKISSYAYIGAIAAYAANTTFDTIYTDAIVWNDGEHAGGIVGLSNAPKSPLTLNNCWFDGTIVQENIGVKKSDGSTYSTYAGGMIACLRKNSATITNCLMTGTIKGINMDNVWGTVAGGMVGRVDGDADAGTLTIKNSLVNLKTEGYSSSAQGNGTVVSQANPGSSLVLEDVYTVTHSWKTIAANRCAEPVSVKEEDGTTSKKVVGSVTGSIAALNENFLTGTAAYEYTGLDFDKYWAVDTKGTPVLKSFAPADLEKVDLSKLNKLADYSWFDGSKKEYVLTTKEQMYGFAILSASNNFKGITVKLGADIVFNEGNAADWATTAPKYSWAAIGDANPFAGTFDGQGHTISGLYAKNTENRYASLFGHVYGGTVKNVRVVNSYLESVISGEFDTTTHFHNFAGLFGRIGQAAKFENIYTDAILVGGKYAGMIGFQDHNSDGPTIKNCWFDGDIIVNTHTKDKGGYAGIMASVRNEKTTIFENCLFTGSITAPAGMPDNYIGGLVGLGPYDATIKMTNCLSAGYMQGVKSGIAGSVIGNNPGHNLSVYTNVYAVAESFASMKGTGGETFPVTKVAYADVKGNLATSKLTGFDFTNTWTTVEGSVPVLKIFKDLAPKVSEAAEIVSINVTAPTKTVYAVGAPLNQTGMVVTALYSDYTTKVITDGFTVSGFDSTTAGTKTVTVNYKGAIATFSVIVETPPATPDETTTLWYDGLKTEYTLNTAGELKGLAKLSQTIDFAGITIKLGADIALNTGNAAAWNSTAPANVWNPIAQFKGTFDGQNHTISGLYYKNTDGNKNVGLFATVENATIKNLIVSNSAMLSTAGSGSNGILVGTAKGVAVENVMVTNTVTATNSTNTGMVAYVDGANPVSFNNVWMAGTVTNAMHTARIGGLVGHNSNTDGLVITIENCLFTGVVKQTHESTDAENYVGGFAGGISANVKISVQNCLSAGSVTKAAGDKTYTGSVVGITSWRGAAYTTYQNAYATDTCYEVGTSREPTAYSGSITILPMVKLIGTQFQTSTALDHTNVWQAVNGYVPVLKSFASYAPKLDSVSVYSLYLTAPTKTYYMIGEALDLSGMVVSSINTDGSETVLTSDDYTVTGFDSTTEGTKTVTVTSNGKTATFEVTILRKPTDPNEETEYWYWYDATKTEYIIENLGMFKGFVTLSQNKDISFEGVTIKLATNIVWNEGNAADWATTPPANVWTAIAGNNENGFKGVFDGQGKTISGIYCKNNGYAAVFARLYGANAAVKNLKIVNSYFESDGTGDSFHNGAGIIGRMNNGATVSGIYTNAFFKGVKGVGIVAFADSVNSGTIEKCWFDGTIDVTGATNVGGMIGQVANGADTVIKDCLFTGTMTGTAASSAYIGGIFGQGPWTTRINVSNSLSAGNMTGVVGGITGAVAGQNPGGNTGTYINVYATKETHTNTKGGGGATFPVDSVDKAEILGAKAATKLAGFDFTNTWFTINGHLPALKIFEDVAPTPAPLELTGITLTAPTKVDYNLGEDLNTSGMTVTAHYNDESTKTVTEYELSGYDKNTVGTQTVTVTYTEGTVSKTATFDVTVSKLLTGISIVAPTKTEYFVGETINTSGLVVTAIYSDSTTEVITSGYTVSSLESSTVGTKTITVNYEGKTATFDVVVKIDPTVLTTEWYTSDPTATEFTISTVGELKGLVQLINTDGKDFTGKTIKLDADIVWNSGNAADWATTAPANVWTPIANFTGTFDGQGHTISGLYYKNTAVNTNCGLFATVENAVIRNLIVANSLMASTAATGGNGVLAGLAEGITVQNVKVESTVTVSGGARTGMVGLADTAAAVSFDKVWMAGTVTNGNNSAYIGGLLGYANTVTGLDVTIRDCLFTGTVAQTNASATGCRAGGFVGSTGANAKIYMYTSLSAGSVTKADDSATRIGSVIGMASAKGTAYNKAVNIYATNECYSTISSYTAENKFSTDTGSSKFVKVNEADLKGDLAMTSAPNLNYTEVWKTVDGATPVLRFVDTMTQNP